MEIRKVIIYITRDGALHTSEQRARQHAKRQRRAQNESARTLENLLKTARPAIDEEPATRPPSKGASAAHALFTEGTHKERIFAAIRAGSKKTSDIKRATSIKANVLYADLAKLRADGLLTTTNRLTKLAKTASAPPREAPPKTLRGSPVKTISKAVPAFTLGTHKERILAAIKAGHQETGAIRAATGIKPNVLYADLGKLRAEGVITPTNRLKTMKEPSKSKRAKVSRGPKRKENLANKS